MSVINVAVSKTITTITDVGGIKKKKEAIITQNTTVYI